MYIVHLFKGKIKKNPSILIVHLKIKTIVILIPSLKKVGINKFQIKKTLVPEML